MRLSAIIVSLLGVAIVGGSVFLIPNKSELKYMADNATVKEVAPSVITEAKQKQLEEGIAKDGLIAQNVSELADSYVAQGKTDKAIELMERYHVKNPTDVQMLDKLGVIYHVAGMEDKYIGILEEQNEILPSVNICYILQAHYSRLYGEDSHPEKTIKVLRHLIKLQPENVQNYKTLIFFQFKAKQGAEVIETVKEFRAHFPNQVDYSFIFPLVDQLIKMGLFDEAFNEADPWVKLHPDPSLKDFTTMFTNANRPDLAMKLMEGRQDAINADPTLLMLNIKASLASKPAQSLELSTNYMKAHPDDLKMLEDYGNIFFAAKRYDEIITLYLPYKEKVLATPKLFDIYRESLNISVKTKPENMHLLVELYERELKDPKTTKDRRKALLFVLQDAGAYKVALPYAEKYAFQYRGDWVLIYEGMLEKHKDLQALAAFRYKYVHTVKLTPEERRYYISIYMEQQNKAEAMPLMWQQAEGKPAKSQEVRDLVYIWGIKPTAQQQAWIEGRALASDGDEEIEWLKILQNMGANESIVNIVQTDPPQERSLPLVKIYFDALRMTKDKTVRNAETSIAIDEENDEQRLAFYAREAQEEGDFKLASKGYERLIGMNPNNIEYMKDRGMTAYYAGDIEAATACLDSYYGAGGEDITAVFYFAELLQQRNTLQARPLFEQTLMLMEKAPSLTMSERVMKVHTLARLHRYKQAGEEMAQLRQENPENPYLQLDNVEFLIDTTSYKQAENMLAEPHAHAKAQLPFELWRLDTTDLLRVERRPMSNELLLVYKKPTSKIPQLKQWADFHPDWINGFYPGYDTVLVQAKSTKDLTATIQGQSLIIEATEAPNPEQMEADTSLAIRRELLHARIEQETHRSAKAIKRLTALKEEYPEDVGVITGLAIAKRGYGKRLQALDLAEEAHMRDPGNRWVNIMIADMKKQDQPIARLDYQWLHMSSNDQFTTQISGIEPVNCNLRVGGAVENDFWRYKGLRNAQGDISRDSGNAQRGQIDALYETEEGPVYKTSLFLNPGTTLGLGENIATYSKLGPINAFIEYNRSDWTYVERIANDVRRNRVGVTQSYAPVPDVSTVFGAALSDYSQDNKDHAAKSISIFGNIHAPVSKFDPSLQDVPVVVGYGLDAEYVTATSYGLNSAGDRYRLYPLISREVHFVDATYRKPFSPSLIGDLTGSFAYDRMTSQGGPSVGGRLTKELSKEWEMQFRASYGISFTQVGSGVTTAGGYVVRKF